MLFEYSIYRKNGEITRREEGLISDIIDSVVFGGVCGPSIQGDEYHFNFFRRFNPNRGEGKHTMDLLRERLRKRGYKLKKIR